MPLYYSCSIQILRSIRNFQTLALRSEVLTVMKIQIMIFGVAIPCSFGSVISNVSKAPTASITRKTKRVNLGCRQVIYERRSMGLGKKRSDGSNFQGGSWKI